MLVRGLLLIYDCMVIPNTSESVDEVDSPRFLFVFYLFRTKNMLMSKRKNDETKTTSKNNSSGRVYFGRSDVGMWFLYISSFS